MKTSLIIGTLVITTAVLVVSEAQTQTFGPQNPLTGKNVRMIAPTTADPTLKTTEDDDNAVILPNGKPRPELFVWLPGTNGHPKGDSLILSTAASGGYRVIGLQYNNHGTAEAACNAANDAECHTRLRQERFTGGVAGAAIPNTVEEGIEHRLEMLLKYLAAKYPEEGWGQYLAGDLPAWQKIVIAGHSQGASSAGFIAKQREVARVVLFSGGADGIGNTLETRKWASWVSGPSKTPMDRWYAEWNAQERLALAEPMAYQDILKIPVDHLLVFKLDLPPSPQPKPLEAHMAVVHDPRYLPQWQWMMGITDKKP